jgi:hypothetical protein
MIDVLLGNNMFKQRGLQWYTHCCGRLSALKAT